MGKTDTSDLEKKYDVTKADAKDHGLTTSDEPMKKPIADVDDTDELLFPDAISCSDLLKKDFPEPVWGVPGIIPQGLTIIASPPKRGKSWFALNLGVAWSVGGHFLGKIKVDELPCLYLALEDNQRRLQKRLADIHAPSSNNLHLCTKWKQGKEGLEEIERWLGVHPATQFIIIDTLARFAGPRSGQGYSYSDDYRMITEFKETADRLSVSIILVHHTRKQDSDDPFQTISGTTGVAAPADTSIVLKRSPGQADAELHFEGRDIVDDTPLALRFDTTIGGWNLIGDAVEHRQSQERQAILGIIRESQEPTVAKEIATRLGKQYPTVKTLLQKLTKEGLIRSLGKTGYVSV